MSLIVQKLSGLLSEPSPPRAGSTFVLSLAVRSDKPRYLPGEPWIITLEVGNQAASDSPPVRFSVMVIDPQGNCSELMADHSLETIPASTSYSISPLPAGGAFHVWSTSDVPGLYQVVFRAYNGSGNVLGSASSSTTFTGSGQDTIVTCSLSPSKAALVPGDALSVYARIANISGQQQTIRTAFLAVGADKEPRFAWTPATTPDTELPAGFDMTAAVAFGSQANLPPWFELPHSWTIGDPAGNYTYGLAIYDYSTPPANPDAWASQPLLAYAVCTVGFSHAANTANLEHFTQVLFHHNERLDVDDLDKLTRGQLEAASLVLGATTAFSDWVCGFVLSLRNGRLYVGPGYGWQFKELVVPQGKWDRDEADQFRRKELRSFGTHLLLQAAPSLFIGSIADPVHAPPDSGMRYDPICAEAYAADGNAAGDGNLDLRLFVQPNQVMPDGAPNKETRRVATRRRILTRFHWLPGYADPTRTYGMALPAGYTPIGYVECRADGNHRIHMRPYPPATVAAHRALSPMDHPAGSVHALHLAAAIVGSYQEGVDLTLRQMSQELLAARGNFAGPSGIDDRLSRVVDDDGVLLPEVVQDAISDALDDRFGDVVDSRGNLLASAVASALAGRASYVVAIEGQVGNGQTLPSVEGFTEDQCFGIVSISALDFTFGGLATSLSNLSIVCERSGRTVFCESKAIAHSMAAAGDERTWDIAISGTANFLLIFVKTVGES